MTGALSVKLDIGQTVKLRPVNDKYPDYFVSLKSHGAENRVVISDSGLDNEWIVKDGLIGKGISLESVTGGYIRHSDSQAWVHPLESGDLYKNDASFTVVNGLAGEGISLQSVNHAGSYLRHHAGDGIQLEELKASLVYKEAASFEVVFLSDSFWTGESALSLSMMIWVYASLS